MKKLCTHLLLLFVAVISSTGTIAQTIFSENFEGTGGTFPSGWALFNVDNLTPATQVAYVNAAWIVRDDFVTPGDTCAFSNSWYNPVGTANDWMISPAITLGSAGYILKWEAVAPDVNYADGYEVRIGTAQTTAGQTTVLTSVAAENQSWTPRQIIIPGSFNNQTVYISFRNNSNDKFLLMVDSIRVVAGATFDASVTATQWPDSEYTMIPYSQSPVLSLGGTVSNLGLQAVTNANLKCNVYNGAMVLQTTATGTPVASLAVGATSSFNLGNYTPSAADLYTFEYVSMITQTDGLKSNDTTIVEFLADTVFARDDGIVAGSLGIGAAEGGQLGQLFVLNTPAQLNSITFLITNATHAMDNMYIHAGVKSWDHTNHVPGATVAITDSVLHDTSTFKSYTLMLDSGAVTLNADTFFIYVQERDSNVTLGRSDNIFTANASWVDWPSSPQGGWAPSEAFGFNLAYVLRANLKNGCLDIDSIGITQPLCAGDANGSIFISASNGVGPYTFLWSNGDTTQTATGLAAGSYSVDVMDQAGCTLQLNALTVNEPSPLAANMVKQNASCDTCVDGTATANPIGGTGPYTFNWASGGTTQTISGLGMGVYVCTVTDAKGCTYVDSIEVGDATGISNPVDGFGIVDVFPNPSRGAFNLVVGLQKRGDLEIRVLDLFGRTIYSESVKSVDEFTKQISIPGISSGHYLLKVSSGGAVQTLNVIVE